MPALDVEPGWRVGGRLVREVDRGFHVGEQVEQVVPQPSEGRAGATRQTVEGGGELGGSTRLDHREHRLRLHEVEPAREEGAEGELAPAGHPRAVATRRGDQGVDERRRARQVHLRQGPTDRPSRSRPVEHLHGYRSPVGGKEPAEVRRDDAGWRSAPCMPPGVERLEERREE